MNWTTLLCDDRIRSYKKSSSTDLRTEFEKDYHRIIGSASFRRLQDKTQVFPLDRSDFVRTRLTHSLEVSSLAKSLGQNISESIRVNVKDDTFLPEHKAAVCDILQCAGLIHDIGNPPFGHFGETSIQDWFKQNLGRLTFKGQAISDMLKPQMLQDFYHFEGNTQAFRVVTRLHFLVDEHGMNLTKALLGTIIKYPVSSLGIDKKSGNIRTKKMGYFYADKDNFEDVQRSAGTFGMRHPLTFLLEAADDIAYKTADIEDAVKKGCISYERLLQELKGFRPGQQTEQYQRIVSWLEERFGKGVQRDYSRPDLYAVQNWVISAQGQMIAGVTDCFTENYDAVMDGSYGKDMFAGTGVELLMDALGDIAFRYAFDTRPILKLEIAAQTIFSFLLERFVDAVIPWDTDLPMTQVQDKMVSLISDNYKKIYSICSKDKDEAEKLYLRLLLVTDYICGMTDSYAKDLYQELNGIV